MALTRAKTISWGKRLILVLLLLCGAAYLVLSFAARSKEEVRKGLEDAIAQSTGGIAEITDMDMVKFVPDIVLKMNGVVVRDRTNKEKSLMKADHLFMAMPLWRMMVAQNAYLGIEGKGIEIASGFLLPKKLSLSFIGVSDSADRADRPLMLVEGTYNSLPLMITLEMTRKGSSQRPLYTFGKVLPMTFKLGTLEATGLYVRKFSSLALQNVSIVKGDIQAGFNIKDIKKSPLHATLEGVIDGVPVTGRLSRPNDGSVILKLETTAQGPEAHRKVERFLDAVYEDTGIKEAPDKIIIEFAPQTGQQHKE